MLLDNTLMLSEEQAITSSAASTNIIDQQAAGDAHTHAALGVRVDETFTGATAVKVSLQTAADSNFTSPTELLGVTFAVAELVAGKTLLKAVLPIGAKRYLRGYYTVTGTATAGKLTMFVTDTAIL